MAAVSLKKQTGGILAAFFWFFLLIPGFAMTPQQMRDLHLRAEKGGLPEANEAVSKFEAELKTHPNDQLLWVYLGSSNTLKSRSESWGPEKLRCLTRGGEQMDSAVAAAPKDPRVRLIRAMNFLQLPTLFGKRSEAHADFDILLTSAADRQNDLDPDERAAIYFFGGESLEMRDRRPEALQIWRKGTAVVQDKELAARLADKISR